MFNEDEDWNDEQETQVLLKSAHINTQKANSPNVKTKLVGKKSLLRTLQTLGSVPEWKTNDHQQDSDSETEAARPHSKKKKKRSKKRKRVGTTAEQQEEGDVDQTFKEEEEEHIPMKKENKKGSSKVKATQRKNKDTTQSTKVIVNPDTTEKMSRKQWKNKTKNKRKCNNKYRQNGPEREVNNAESTAKDKPNEEVQTESYNSETISQTPAKTKENERKLKIRKNTEGGHSCPTQTQTLKEEKQIKKEKKTRGCKVERSATIFFDGSKQKVEEPEVEITDHQQEITIKRAKHELRQQSLKRERLRKMLHCQENDKQDSVEEMSDEPAVQQEEEEEEEEQEGELKQDRSASLRARMEQRLESARFRYINEILYSTSSGEAKRMFTQDHEAFWIYHRGYTAQVQRWPTNPVDEIIAYIRHKPSTVVVADFGCGDCKIARSVKNKVHSFDLAATCELVTVCDMANVPLCDASVGIAVFCLSLMGTNLPDFLVEANRVLKNGGILKIAEVASRFENVRSFITALAGLGFKMVSMDTANTHFCSFEFMKTGGAPENIKKFGLQLKPCLYKKR